MPQYGILAGRPQYGILGGRPQYGALRLENKFGFGDWLVGPSAGGPVAGRPAGEQGVAAPCAARLRLALHVCMQ